MTHLPGISAEIAAAIGEDLTLNLLRVRGGTRVYIPATARNSALAAIIGVSATETLIEALGAGEVVLPCGHMRGAGARKSRAMRALKAGQSIQAVALECDLHRRTVENYAAELRAAADDPQGQFDL